MMNRSQLKERLNKIYPLHRPIWMILQFIVLLLILTIPAYTSIDYIWIYFGLGFWFVGLILVCNSAYIHIRIMKLYDSDKDQFIKYIEKLHRREQNIVNQNTIADKRRYELLSELLDDLY